MKLTIFALSASLLLPAFVRAQEPAKPHVIDFTAPLRDVEGHEIKPKPDAPAMTLSDVAVNALEAQSEDDRGLSGVEKFKLDALARKVYGGKAVALTVEDLSTIKQRIGKSYGPLIVGITWRMLDPVEARK